MHSWQRGSWTARMLTLLPLRPAPKALNRILLALLMGLLIASPPTIEGPVRLLREGDLSHQRGQYSRSLDYYREASKTRALGAIPDVRAAKLQLTRRNQPVEEAMDYLERAGADEGVKQTVLGIMAFGRKDHVEARQYLADALKNRPFDGEARYYLARSYLLSGDYDEAIREFDRVLAAPAPALSRWREAACYNLGLLHMVRGEQAAVEHLLEAAKGKVDAELGKKALTLLSALETGGEDRQSEDPLALGVALLAVGEARLARVQFEKALDLTSRRAHTLAYLGYIHWLEGEHSRAGDLLEQSVRLQADSPIAHYFLGVLRRAQGRLADALAEFQRVIAIDPKSAPAYVELGQTLILERDYSGAASAFERAVEIHPDNAGYVLRLAQFYLDHAIGLDRALVVARKAVELAPESADALDALGWALWADGQAYDARHTLELAIASNPDLARAHYHLAVLLERTGDAEAAAREFRRVIDLEPDGSYASRAEAALLDHDSP